LLGVATLTHLFMDGPLSPTGALEHRIGRGDPNLGPSARHNGPAALLFLKHGLLRQQRGCMTVGIETQEGDIEKVDGLD
jgi:hypothetical protein